MNQINDVIARQSEMDACFDRIGFGDDLVLGIDVRFWVCAQRSCVYGADLERRARGVEVRLGRGSQVSEEA
jgi:hypothetical protein